MRLVERDGFGAFELEQGVFTYEITSKSRQEVEDRLEQNRRAFDLEDYPIAIGEYYVIPFGKDNDLPSQIKDKLRDNHLAPRILTKRVFLTWGQGPGLYRMEYSPEKGIKKVYVQDSEVENWLRANNYREQLRMAINDFVHADSVVYKRSLTKGRRIGNPKVHSIEYVPQHKVRKGYLQSDKRKIVTHALVGNWRRFGSPDVVPYPLAKDGEVAKYPVSVRYSHMPAYGEIDYPFPDLVNVFPWIERSSTIPFVLKTLTKNNLTIPWHIKVPKAYWDAKREYLKLKCREQGKVFSESMLESFKREKFQQVAQVLSGAENTGKFFTSEKIFEAIGDRHLLEHAWEIESIDQKIKDFIKSQIEISQHASVNTVAGMGLHAALSNVSADGRSDSGSEQLYALRNYMLTEVDMPEEIICQAWNEAIALNFPEKNIRLGFIRNLPVREQDVTPKDRVNDSSL